MSRVLKCLQCGYAWQPGASNQDECPQCRSRDWEKPQTANPDDVKWVHIYEEEHPHYKLHYHIATEPSFAQGQILDLFIEKLKGELGTDTVYGDNRPKWTDETYRITPDRVLKCDRGSKNVERILGFTDREHIHFFFYTDEGRSIFVRVIKHIFPNADHAFTEVSDSVLEEKRKCWEAYERLYG